MLSHLCPICKENLNLYSFGSYYCGNANSNCYAIEFEQDYIRKEFSIYQIYFYDENKSIVIYKDLSARYYTNYLRDGVILDISSKIIDVFNVKKTFVRANALIIYK